jgi:hypothetical protein
MPDRKSQWSLPRTSLTAVLSIILTAEASARADEFSAALPRDVMAVWNPAKAHRDATSTREQICINGLWRWQPAEPSSMSVPAGKWGYFKVPGCWPGVTDYLQKDCQTVHAHPSWKDTRMGNVSAAWYQREIAISSQWTGRRIVLSSECVNSLAIVYVDGTKAGEIRFPGGEVDLTAHCRPGGKHLLAMLVVALPLKAVLLSYNDTASARQVKSTVPRRGLCGDLYVKSTPSGARIGDVKISTSVRQGRISFDVTLAGLDPNARYSLSGRIRDGSRFVTEPRSQSFAGKELHNGRFAFAAPWKPDRLWDVHRPGNTYDLSLSLLDSKGELLDTAFDLRFGFREFWIYCRDFY